MSIKVAINGAAGKMGRRLIALSAADVRFDLVAALESGTHPVLGTDAGDYAGIGRIGVLFSVVGESDADVVIDFSVPDASVAAVAHCLEYHKPIVIATTGFEEQQDEFIRKASERIPVVWAPSMSTAVNLVMKLTEVAAASLQKLPAGVDVEIVERHHRFKEDAPSGTALRFGKIVAEAMGQTAHIHGRHGKPGQRPPHEIGYHALRIGDNPGEHTIIFGMLGETIELRVAATNRDCYAQGALMAAEWVLGKPPGLYGMNDVLGF